MFVGRIVPVKTKVYEIRKFLGVTQSELAKGVFSRVNISNIEKGDQEIPPETAEKLYNRIMEMAKTKENQINVYVHDLTDNEDKQAERIILRHAKTIEIAMDSKLDEIESLIVEYEITPKVRMESYKKINRAFFKNNKYGDSEIYIRKGIEISIKERDLDEEIGFVLDKVRNNIKRKKYEEALYDLDYCKGITENDSLLKRVYFNKATVLKNMKMHEDSLFYVRKLSELKLNIKEELDVNNLYGLNLISLKKLEEAKEVFMEGLLLAKQNKIENMVCKSYRNIAEVHKELEEYSQAIINMENAITDTNDNYYAARLCFMGELKKLVGKHDEAIIYFNESIKYVNIMDSENIELIEKNISFLLEIYITINEKEEKIQELIMMAENSTVNMFYVYPFIIKYYKNDTEKINLYNSKLLDIIIERYE